MLKQFSLNAIKFYQRYLNFNSAFTHTFFLTDAACRFSPTCSEYTYQAITRYGILGGLWRGVKRILNCHPFSKGGKDPVV